MQLLAVCAGDLDPNCIARIVRGVCISTVAALSSLGKLALSSTDNADTFNVGLWSHRQDKIEGLLAFV